MSQDATVRAGSRQAELRSFVIDRLTRSARDGSIALVTVPAPDVPPETLLRVADRSHAVIWDPPSAASAPRRSNGTRSSNGSNGGGVSALHDCAHAVTSPQTIDSGSIAGVGACALLRHRGPDRFASLRHAGDALLARVAIAGFEDVAPIEPRLYGGLAFDVGAADEPAWRDFGDCGFTLPRYLYRACADGARLAVAVRPEEAVDDALRSAWADALLALGERLAAAPSAPVVTIPRRVPQSAPIDDPSWIRRVEEIRDAIRRGEVEKIVAARRAEMIFDEAARSETAHSIDPADVLQILAGGLRASTRFAFLRDGASFLGATPERLVAKRGLDVVTEALAGSIESGGGHAAELLDSGKDRHEQQLVVDSIVRRLDPLCATLEVAPRRIRELRDVLHLLTPIRGTLRSERHLLDLAEALHPTPAVGGVPTEDAMEWIREREDVPRGWYAAPVGWFDARGDGELWVGLRSCLLQPGRALLYAGAGIVADSDPEAELQETELKLEAMRSALLDSAARGAVAVDDRAPALETAVLRHPALGEPPSSLTSPTLLEAPRSSGSAGG